VITEWETLDGHILTLGRLDRREIDAFSADNAPPVPPTKTVETWAGDEQAPDLDEPKYQAALGRYYRNLGKSQVELIAPAITLPRGVDFGALYELAESGLVEFPPGSNGSNVGYLLYVLDADDLETLVKIVFYNSTVTEKGIGDARARFGVKWMNESILAWGVPGTPGAYNLEFEARRAARYNLVPWCEFCDLTGPEQSALVCFYRMDARLEYFQAEWRNRKVK